MAGGFGTRHCAAPAKLRPISVMSVVYRLWAGCCCPLALSCSAPSFPSLGYVVASCRWWALCGDRPVVLGGVVSIGQPLLGSAQASVGQGVLRWLPGCPRGGVLLVLFGSGVCPPPALASCICFVFAGFASRVLAHCAGGGAWLAGPCVCHRHLVQAAFCRQHLVLVAFPLFWHLAPCYRAFVGIGGRASWHAHRMPPLGGIVAHMAWFLPLRN